MQINLSELKKIFSRLPENPNLKIDNLFSMGTRGFYENPFTEVLAYLLNEKTEYKQRDRFFKILLSDLKDDDFVNSLILNSEIKTQFITSNGKYIDLIIYNDKNILVFENKINHWLANPFDDYERDINLRYSLHNKKYVILSYKKEECPKNWSYISIRQVFDKILNSKLHSFDNKWDYFVHDFLIQFSNSKLIDMDQSYLNFYEKNFSQIIFAKSQLKEFFIDIAEKIREKIEISRYKYTETWGEFEHAIRFYPFSYENNVTLIFKENGKFSVAIYYYNKFDSKTEIHKCIGNDEYEYWDESGICCFAKFPNKEYSKLDDATAEILLQLDQQKKYYSRENMDINLNAI